MGLNGVLMNDEMVLKPTSDQRYPLGTRGYTRDGRVFRYCKNGATALSAHVVVMSAVVQSTGVANDNYFADAPTTNSTAVMIRFLSTKTMMGSTDNFYADGFVYIRTGTGAGEMVRIFSHEGATTTAVAGHKLNLYRDSKFAVAPVTTTAVRVGILQHPFKKVVVASTLAFSASAGIPIGVTPVAVTASYYFWAQTAGQATVKQAGRTVRSWPVRVSSALAGSVVQGTAATTAVYTAIGIGNLVGRGLQPAGSTAASQYCVVKLELDS